MSKLLSNAAWMNDTTTSGTQKFILLTIAGDANEKGIYSESLKAIAARCALTERTVKRHIDAMVLSGLLTRVEKNVIRVNLKPVKTSVIDAFVAPYRGAPDEEHP